MTGTGTERLTGSEILARQQQMEEEMVATFQELPQELRARIINNPDDGTAKAFVYAIGNVLQRLQQEQDRMLIAMVDSPQAATTVQARLQQRG